MAVSEKTRKIVWARSGNRCAICRRELVPAQSTNTKASVIGDECHIVAREPGGPRGVSALTTEQRDEPDNLVLLCPNDHRQIDDDVDTYTAVVLQAIKKQHEDWVRHRLDRRPTTEGDSVVFFAARADSGAFLTDIACPSHGAYYKNDQPQTRDEAKMIGAFFQELQDCIDIWSDIGPSGRIDAQFDFDERLAELRLAGWLVYVTQRSKELTSDGFEGAMPVDVLYVLVLRTSNPSVSLKDEEIEKLMTLPEHRKSEFTCFVPIAESRGTKVRFV